MQYKHKNEDILMRMGSRLNASDYMRNFLTIIFPCADKPIKLRNKDKVDEIRRLANMPQNTQYKSMRDIQTGHVYWNEQLVDFIPSNLGKDYYICYFICNGCKGRVKYLYEYDTTESPLCRNCLGIKYKRTKKRSKLPWKYRSADEFNVV